MVMCKVSKAIAASFLCLSLFNASGDFASAMMSSTSDKSKKPVLVPGVDVFVTPDEKKDKDEDKDKTPDDKKGLSETTIRVIIGGVSGVGGIVLGTLLGKFVF